MVMVSSGGEGEAAPLVQRRNAHTVRYTTLLLSLCAVAFVVVVAVCVSSRVHAARHEQLNDDAFANKHVYNPKLKLAVHKAKLSTKMKVAPVIAKTVMKAKAQESILKQQKKAVVHHRESYLQQTIEQHKRDAAREQARLEHDAMLEKQEAERYQMEQKRQQQRMQMIQEYGTNQIPKLKLDQAPVVPKVKAKPAVVVERDDDGLKQTVVKNAKQLESVQTEQQRLAAEQADMRSRLNVIQKEHALEQQAKTQLSALKKRDAVLAAKEAKLEKEHEAVTAMKYKPKLAYAPPQQFTLDKPDLMKVLAPQKRPWSLAETLPGELRHEYTHKYGHTPQSLDSKWMRFLENDAGDKELKQESMLHEQTNKSYLRAANHIDKH